MKRYNMARQAVEIYFEDSKSVLISFFGQFYLDKFVHNLQRIIRKKRSLPRIEVVESPAVYFSEKRFRERWVKGEMSNFQYLMLLNKYSGRSFNDIAQYPVFPWILKEFVKPQISLTDPTIYRNLLLPIAGLTKAKQRAVEDSKNAGIQTVPYPTHYLPANAVLGYMFRIEPFASLFKGSDQESTFNVVDEEWAKCESDPSANKELIPQFYYFSPMFANYNKYCFRSTCNRHNTSHTMDNVQLPVWAHSSHHFVQQNSLALESPYVSQNLDKWIDLVFGEKQQDPKAFNQFKDICDEATAGEDRPTKEQVAELRDYGSNPTKMFSEKHPQMNLAEYLKRTQYTIFNNYVKDENRLFALLRIHSFKQAIVFISAYETKAIVVLNSGRCHRTKEEYINVPNEKLLSFEKKETVLYPSVKVFDGSLNCDAQRTVAPLENGTFLATCRHYDNSWKITNFSTGEILAHFYFHKVTPSP